MQQQSDRDFLIVDLGSFHLMECTSSKSDGQGQKYKAGGVQKLLWNRTSISCTRTVVFGGTDSNALGDDDMRKVIGKVNDI